MSKDGKVSVVFEGMKWVVGRATDWLAGSTGGEAFAVDGGYEVPLGAVFGPIFLEGDGVELIRTCAEVCFHRDVQVDLSRSVLLFKRRC